MNLDPIQAAAQAQFAKQSHRYGKGHILENVEDVRDAAEGIDLPPKAKVLDIAAANGYTGLFFAERGCEVILADIAAPMLDRARELAAQRGLTVTTRQHPAEELPYPDASFDLVTCRVAAHHFSSPKAFVQESARVLRPEGYFILIDGTVRDDEPEAEAWIHQVETLRDSSHARFLTPRSWRTLCEEAGLEVLRSQLFPFKQPNLEWYFQTAATSSENQAAVRKLLAEAPESAKRLFQIQEEGGTVVWWWDRLTLVARKKSA